MIDKDGDELVILANKKTTGGRMKSTVEISHILNTTAKASISAFMIFLFTGIAFAQPSGNSSGWRLINYSFKDGSARYEHVLAGTSSKMYDLVSHKGSKGNLQISQNRYDDKTRKILAGVTYQVRWSDPPAFLQSGKKASINYQLSTSSSISWKPPQQSVYLNQGLQGVYFSAPDGTKYITKDMKETLTSEKVIEAGTPGTKRTIKVTLGNGYSATYTYEWK
ncbi:MAG: hypothetical protein OEL57_04985 [Trichlorobacter sp.]|uniref:hypothetical protein n=1 Tax=Trichlorobacter sp. TaxID=2911007 RepID=UPI0025649B18|nr:hypothetical protein [Trichlorobacter sp.]MDK9717248.1 hypothetical protein [Trichlorobacter sp.]